MNFTTSKCIQFIRNCVLGNYTYNKLFKMTPEIESKNSLDTNISVPKWFNKNYMENVLQLYKNDKTLKVNTIINKPALGKGENFGGILIRCNINYTNCNSEKLINKNDIFIIVKISFEGDQFAIETMKDYDIFNREMNIYENILPKLKNYLIEINDNDELFANTIFVDYKNSAIHFEDLSARSFVMADRTQGLDILHTKLALKKLAKMHATSAVLNERSPGIFQNYDRGMFNRHTNSYSGFFVNTLKACSEFVSQLDDNVYKGYGEKLNKLVPFVMEGGKRVFDVIPNQLNVLVHGDFWTNNIMYKYNDVKEPIDAILLDFQYSCWASPAIDLFYFFYTSIKTELKMNNQDELIQYYYNILSDTLKVLEFKGKIPSLHEFWIDIHRKSFYAVTSTCVVQPVMLNEETADADFNALMGEDERAFNFKRVLFQNKTVEKHLKELLPIFDRRGLIDFVN